MGCRTLHDRDQDLANLYCSTTEVAFGPVFGKSDDHDAEERAEAFLRWLARTDTWRRYEHVGLPSGDRDPRLLTDRGLQHAYGAWLVQEADQWAREEAAEAVEP